MPRNFKMLTFSAFSSEDNKLAIGHVACYTTKPNIMVIRVFEIKILPYAIKKKSYILLVLRVIIKFCPLMDIDGDNVS